MGSKIVLVLFLLFTGCSTTSDWRAERLKALSSQQALQYAIYIHWRYLHLPENEATGSHEWHKAWIEQYNKMLKEGNQ